MDRPIEYMVVGADTSGDLEDEVNIKIKDGWIPLGGLWVSPLLVTYYQAMVLYRDNRPEAIFGANVVQIREGSLNSG